MTIDEKVICGFWAAVGLLITLAVAGVIFGLAYKASIGMS